MLVERDTLLGELVAGVDDALAGRGRLVFVGGESGVGKSTLVRALVRQVGLVGGRDVARRNAALDGVGVHEQCHECFPFESVRRSSPSV